MVGARRGCDLIWRRGAQTSQPLDAARRWCDTAGMVNRGRFTAQLDGEFVVFLIGMRINRPWKVREWLPVFVAMPKMLRWLDQHPETGLLAWHNAWIKGPAVVQYWRSFEQLDRFARAGEQPHLPAWKAWNQAV